MTQPPEGPGAHEPTRRLDPQDDQPTQAYSEPPQPYEQSVPYEQPSTQYQPEQGGYYDGPYTQAQPYIQGEPYTQGQQYPPGQPYQRPPAPPAKHTGRTVGLSLAIILALIVIAFVGYRIVDGNGASNTTASTSTETSQEATTTESTTESTTEPTSETTTTTDSVPTGQVTYQITGNGDLVGLRYTTGSGVQFLAAVGSPWQQTTTVTGSTAEISAIVIRGKLTCTISRGETVLSSSTSASGTLNCSATLPSSE